MKNNFLSIDAGKYGVMTIWEDIKPIKFQKYGELKGDSPKKKDREYVNFIGDWKRTFMNYTGCEAILERIIGIYDGGGAFASFELAKIIGTIKGLAYGLCEVIEKGYTPREWKARIDKELGESYLVKPPKVKWEKGEKKKRSITLCEELYPDINLRTGEIIEHKKEGWIEEVKDDNQADSILIGTSYLIEKGKIKIVNENGKHKIVKV